MHTGIGFPSGNLRFEEARRIVLDAGAGRATPPERAALADALGRTLAGPVVSADALPPFDTSAMDGVAVRAADFHGGALPLVLPRVATVVAGAVPGGALAPGTCVGMMTGAPLPPGADAVVPVEHLAITGNDVRFGRAPAPGAFVRRRGEAMAPGDEAFRAGHVVTPGAVGLLAALGVAEIAVAARPRVAVVVTGDELVGMDEPPGPGQIRDANGPALAAQVVAAGGVPVGPFFARDDVASIRRALGDAEGADVLVFVGGVSVGERDLVRGALEAHGVTWAFWGVRQRPGGPMAFGALPDGRPVVGLPGNPVSATVCFEVYVRPLLAALLGRPEPVAPLLPAVLDEAIPKAPGLHTFARVTAHRADDGRLYLRSAGPQGSHVFRTVAHSDGLAYLPEEWASAMAGASVAFQPWGW